MKIQRNQPCLCGSQLKYKHCCLNKKMSTNNPSNLLLNQDKSASATNFRHPSMPKGKNDLEFNSLYFWTNLSLADFLNGYQIKNNESIRRSLKSYNNLMISIIRNGDDVLIELIHSRKTLKHECLRLQPCGTIRAHTMLKDNEKDELLYVLFHLLKHDQCPWGNIFLNWKESYSVLSALYASSNSSPPLALSGILMQLEVNDPSQLKPLETEYFPLKKCPNNPSNKITHQNFDYEQIYFFNLLKKIPQGTQSLLCFLFNDHTYLPVQDLLTSPYSVLIPPDMIPRHLYSGHLNNFEHFNSNHSTTQINRDIARLSNIFLSQFFSHKGLREALPLYFTAGKTLVEIGKHTSLYQAREFTLLNKQHISHHLEGSKLSFNLNLPNNESGQVPKRYLYEDTFIIDLSDQKIYWHNLKNQISFCFESISQYFNGSGIINGNDAYIELPRDYNLIQIKNFHKNHIERKFDIALTLAPYESIDKTDFQISYLVQEKPNSGANLFDLSLSILIKNSDARPAFHLHAIPHFFKYTLIAMNEGLTSYFDNSLKDALSPRSSDKRKNSLKFIRHSGIFRIFLLELLELREKEKNISKRLSSKELKTFLTNLLNKLSLILLDGDQSKLTKNFLDSRIPQFLMDYMQDFFHYTGLENSHPPAFEFQYDGRFYKMDPSEFIFQILNNQMNFYLSKYDDNTFKKGSIKELELADDSLDNSKGVISAASDNSLSLPPPSLKIYEEAPFFPELYKMISEGKTDVYFNGQKLSIIDESSLKAFVKLDQNEEGKINWFELHPQVFFNGQEISFDQIQQIKNKNIIYFNGLPYYINLSQMPKIKYLNAFWEKLLNQKTQFKKLKDSDSIVQKERSLTLDVLCLRAQGIDVQSTPEWSDICHRFDSLLTFDQHLFTQLFNEIESPLPLKDYQKIGTQWLYKLYQIGLGGILADDMGLGKTIQTIAFINILKHKIVKGVNLIVVPTSLIYNWLSEFKKFAPLIKVVAFESKSANVLAQDIASVPQNLDVVLCTYGLMNENAEFFQQIKWNTVFFDEAQNLKNITSTRTSIARGLKAQSIFCLSGTPMENHFGEFYSLLDLCVPGCLGNYADFMKVFNLNKKTNASSSTEMGNIPSLSISQDQINYLKRKVSPLILRRLKSDILSELPEKTESEIYLNFDKKQRKLYRDVAVSWNDKIKNLISKPETKNSQLQMLTALLRLRQICTNPNMIENLKYNEIPPKFDLLIETLAEIKEKNEHVIIFTNFINTLESVSKLISNIGMKTFTIHGGVSANSRKKSLAEFDHEESSSALIMTLKTGGVGLNLTKASYVFHLEPWWNPAAENQATDRAHRMGQTKHVQVYRYIMKDSIEEKIQLLKKKKSSAFNALFDTETEADLQTFNGKITPDEFSYLLSE